MHGLLFRTPPSLEYAVNVEAVGLQAMAGGAVFVRSEELLEPRQQDVELDAQVEPPRVPTMW